MRTGLEIVSFCWTVKGQIDKHITGLSSLRLSALPQNKIAVAGSGLASRTFAFVHAKVLVQLFDMFRKGPVNDDVIRLYPTGAAERSRCPRGR